MPVGIVAADVGGVVPVDNVALLAALEEDGAFVVLAEVIDPVAPDEVAIEELPDPCEDVLLLGIEALELIELIVASDDVGAACVNSREIPLMPSTDPVWMLEMGLHGVEIAFLGAGV